MRTTFVFLHLLGFALWIGGALATMVIRVGAKREGASVVAATTRLSAQVQTWIVAPGALIAVGSGFALAFWRMSHGASDILSAPAISIMMATGTVAGLLVLFVGLPTAQRMAFLAQPTDAGDFPPSFERLRRRQAIVQSVAGVLVLVALWFGATWPG